MKTYLLLFLLLTFALFGCFNPVRKNALKEQIHFGNDIPTEMSLLWRIDSRNLEHSSYLFGTMHLIQEKYWYFPNELKERIENSDKLVLEIAGLPSPSESLELITLDEGSFFDFFNQEQTDSIYIFLEEQLGLNKELVNLSFSNLKPFALVQLVTAQQFGSETQSYELSMGEIAKQKEIELIGLETAEEQIALFDNLSKNEQTEMVMDVIRTFDGYTEQLDELQALYRRQRIDSLYYLVQNEAENLGPTEAQLIDNRNQNWIPKIEKIIKKNKAFIAVGAAHLYGKEGIIELLKKENYVLTPIQL